MDTVVFLALTVLAAVFLVSLLILLVMCQRRRMQIRTFKLATTNSKVSRFSKLRNDDLDGHIMQLSPLIAQTLDKNAWVYDVTGLLQHCVAVLRLCHQLTDQLAAIPLQHASPQLSHMLRQATLRVMPRFDDLLSAVASPAVDIRVLEARATALATVCWALYLPFSLISQKYRESMGEPLQQMDHHLDALRQAAEIAERANLGKLELDWSHIDAVAEHVAAREAASVVTETTPLVDSIDSEPIGRNPPNESETNSVHGNGNHPVDPSG
ncbi:hypothetical protein KIN20_020692 [Parelaphostrongylus tenuis]|uniref:Transmembrane protein 98 n=1 Tax=Parelaphostrongylus tenuis TaxID=148309 RepID=A0AAD5MMU9_PARTN|nr:hypothetical protein KIN20_020692 [Parelaphostrongylus tenuis]